MKTPAGRHCTKHVHIRQHLAASLPHCSANTPFSPSSESTAMKQATSLKAISALAALALTSLNASAHEGHGLPGISHWHSSDALLFVALAAVFGLTYWLGGRK
jgi:hypothetical protein